MVFIYYNLGNCLSRCPFNLLVDKVKVFLSAHLNSLANSLGCNLIPIAVEAHLSLIAERYDDPLKIIVDKLMIDNPTALLSLIVDYANLPMSYTVGPEGFTPAIIAFESQPWLPVGKSISTTSLHKSNGSYAN